MLSVQGSNDSQAVQWSQVNQHAPMVDDATTIPSESQAYAADLAVLAAATAYTDSKIPKTYVNGTLKTNRRLRWIDSTVTAGGAGNATFYLTSDLTSSGTARATAIDLDSVTPRTEDNASQYAWGAITSPNIKTVIVNVFKQAFAGAVVLGINLLGSVSNAAAPNGVVVKIVLDGDAA